MGIDLAWKISPPKERGTGFCVIDLGGRVTDVGLLTTDDEILALAHDDTWIGIDASLIVPLEEGMRGCERQFRSMGMKVLPTSRRFYHEHYGGCRGEGLGSRLRKLNFEPFGQGSKAYFEVYPYAVLQAVCPGRPADYKRGGRTTRELASAELLRRLLEWEPSIQLPRSSMPLLVEGMGAADRMDAFMAAVLLYRHWISSGSLSLVVGDNDDGHILLPRGAGQYVSGNI